MNTDLSNQPFKKRTGYFFFLVKKFVDITTVGRAREENNKTGRKNTAPALVMQTHDGPNTF